MKFPDKTLSRCILEKSFGLIYGGLGQTLKIMLENQGTHLHSAIPPIHQEEEDIHHHHDFTHIDCCDLHNSEYFHMHLEKIQI